MQRFQSLRGQVYFNTVQLFIINFLLVLNLVIKSEFNKVLLAISSYCDNVRLFVFSIVPAIYNNIGKFQITLLKYSII